MNFSSQVFVDFGAGLDNHAAFDRVDNVVEGSAAHDTISQALDLFSAFDNRRRADAFKSSAVLLGDNYILGDVDQSARQVTRVGGLQRSVRQTFAGAVCRDEVLQHIEAFAEVGTDRSLDDFAGWFGHQTSHTGELTNLLGRATSSGVAHDTDRIQFVQRLFAFVHRLEHFLGNLVGYFGPNGDHLVVAFAVCDDAVLILLFDVDNIGIRLCNEGLLRIGSDEIVNTNRDSRFGRV